MECERLISKLLNETYQVEHALIDTLDLHLHEVQNDELRNRLEEQIEETQTQADKIKDRVEELDREVIDPGGEFLIWLKNAGTISFAGEEDKQIRLAIMEYSLKYFQRAYIKTLLTCAEECNDQKTKELCESILEKEVEVTEIIENDLNGLVTDFLNRHVVEQEKIDWNEDFFE